MGGPVLPEKTVTVTVQTGEPELVGAAFDMVHTIARAHGLDDVESIDIEMTVMFRGSPHPSRFEAFKGQINRLWMARVKPDKVERSNEGVEG